MKITLKWLQSITLFKDFETIFAFNLLNSFTDHYFGQILSRLVVFLSDDELIFLLLFETMISQACNQVLRPPKPFNVSNCPFLRQLNHSFLMFVCPLGERWPALASLSRKTSTRPRPPRNTKLAYLIWALKSLMENANWRR